MKNSPNILLISLLLLLISCGAYEEHPLKVIYAEEMNSEPELIQGMPAMDITEGQELRIQLVTTGCFVEKDEPIILIKKRGKLYSASVYSKGKAFIDNKILDSTFKNTLRIFSNDCKKFLLNKKKLTDTSVSSLLATEFRNHEEIIISDGLHIQGITIDNSISRNPFNELVTAIYWFGQERNY